MIIAEFTSNHKDLQVNSLYQWDINQTVKISGVDFGTTSVQVHFCNKKSEKALVVNSTVPSGGAVTANIPNSLLQEPYDVIAYIYQTSGITANTIKTIRIPVIARQKPNDYNEPTGDTVIEIHEIELEAKALIDGLTASNYSSTAMYKRPNIVYYGTSSYICLSNTEITGIAPTDTTKWQKLCNGLNVTSVALDTSGNLVFTFDDNSTKTVEIKKIEGVLVDEINANTAAYTNAAYGLVGEDITLELGTAESTSGAVLLPVKSTSQTLYEGQVIYYDGETATIHKGLLSTEIVCLTSSKIYAQSGNTITVQNVRKYDELTFGNDWTEVAAGGTFTVVKGETYQIEFVLDTINNDNYIAQGAITIGEYSETTCKYIIGTEVGIGTSSSNFPFAHTYFAQIDSAYALTCNVLSTNFTAVTQNVLTRAFRIRRIS